MLADCLQEDIAQVGKTAILQSDYLEAVASATCRDACRKALVREDEDDWFRLDLGVQVLAVEEHRVVRLEHAGLAGQRCGIKTGHKISFCCKAVHLK